MLKYLCKFKNYLKNMKAANENELELHSEVSEKDWLSLDVSDVKDETVMEVLKRIVLAESTIFWRIKAILWNIWRQETPDQIIEALEEWRKWALDALMKKSANDNVANSLSNVVLKKPANDDIELDKVA